MSPAHTVPINAGMDLIPSMCPTAHSAGSEVLGDQPYCKGRIRDVGFTSWIPRSSWSETARGVVAHWWGYIAFLCRGSVRVAPTCEQRALEPGPWRDWMGGNTCLGAPLTNSDAAAHPWPAGVTSSTHTLQWGSTHQQQCIAR